MNSTSIYNLIGPFRRFINEYKSLVLVSVLINVMACVISRLVFSLVTMTTFDVADFGMFYDVSKDAMANGFSNTYDQVFWAGQGRLEYRYFPMFLVLFSAFTLIDVAPAYIVFFCMNQVLMLVSCHLLIEMIGAAIFNVNWITIDNHMAFAGRNIQVIMT